MKPIKKARLLQGLSQAKLARRIRVTQPMISDFERGRLAPGPELRRRLSEALGIPEALFFPPNEDEIE